MLAKIEDTAQWACPFLNAKPCLGARCAVFRLEAVDKRGGERRGFCGAGGKTGVFLSMRTQPDRPLTANGSTETPSAKRRIKPATWMSVLPEPPARPPVAAGARRDVPAADDLI